MQRCHTLDQVRPSHNTHPQQEAHRRCDHDQEGNDHVGGARHEERPAPRLELGHIVRNGRREVGHDDLRGAATCSATGSSAPYDRPALVSIQIIACRRVRSMCVVHCLSHCHRDTAAAVAHRWEAQRLKCFSPMLPQPPANALAVPTMLGENMIDVLQA